MSKNVIREVRNRVRAESRMQAQFAEAREKALKAVEDEISALYAEGQEIARFRFDGFSCWSRDGGLPTEIRAFFDARYPDWHLSGVSMALDNWFRGVIELAKADAVVLGKLVEAWNAGWEYDIARHYDVEQNDYYNAYHVSFGPATGSEHQITVSTGGRYTTDSWQWNG